MAGTAAFSTRRALKHVGLLALVLILLAAAASPWVASPKKFGEGVGRFVAFASLAAYGLSYLWQTGRRRLAGGLGASLVLCVAALVVWLATLAPGRRAPTPLTAADQGPLTVDTAGSKLSHATLAFSLAAPGPGFQEITQETRPKIGQAFPGRHDVTCWGYRHEDTGAGLLVLLIKQPLDTREALEGVSHGFRESFTGQAKFTVSEDKTSWTDAERSVLFVGASDELGNVALRFLAGPTFGVGVIAVDTDAAAARATVMTLTL